MSDRGLDFFLTLAVDGVKAAIRSPGDLRWETFWVPWASFFGSQPRFLAWQIAMLFRRFPQRKGNAPRVSLDSVRRLVRVMSRGRNDRVLQSLALSVNPEGFESTQVLGGIAARAHAPLLIDLEEAGSELLWRHPLFVEAWRVLRRILAPEPLRIMEGDLSRIPRGFARHLVERLFAALDFELPQTIHEDEWDATLGAWRVQLMRLGLMQRGRGAAIWALWQRLHREAPNLIKRAPHNLPAGGLVRRGREGHPPARTRLGWYVLGVWDQAFLQGPLQPDAVHQLLARHPMPGADPRDNSFSGKLRRVDELHRYILHGRGIWEEFGYTPARAHLRPVAGNLIQCLKDASWNHGMMGVDTVFRAAWKHWDQYVPPIPDAAPRPLPMARVPAPIPAPARAIIPALPDDLEVLRVKDPYALALLGQRLHHCIGSLWGTRHWFFHDGGTVCAQVDPRRLRLVTCLDSYNRSTPASRTFSAFLLTRLRELRIHARMA
ncbi:MAG: hypothetical protein J0L75_11140 [Spirochaetes bacterium]|nr:hypothetical protein [Spirochaetota bacterium]